ncbi:hypothetical protein [Nonomuraea roseoviolacea]|uniref:WD40 repeat domain-containing protein n=1 Tax=Nonomuraea roseoviolacea subsp. carminata TaxID=160689 RepID=A0ABT1K1N1_9ACTN|nr:hypothetical protein [Nonomuraea roseoviolacea]MCP2347906.1 hypothetical protein [Nonomuraea roseoviolacea subsp. carminata]
MAAVFLVLFSCQGVSGRNVQAVTYGEAAECPGEPDESLASQLAEETRIECVGWTLHVPYGVGIRLAGAVNRIRPAEADDDGVVPIEITPDGHRVAYLDVGRLRYLVKDLRSGAVRPITPRLTAEEIAGITSVVSSSDGRRFAVSTSENRRTYVADFETGRTRSLDEVCWAYGLTADRLMGSSGCYGADVAIDIVRFDGTATRFRSEENAPDGMSPDLRRYLDGDAVHETATGRKTLVVPGGRYVGARWADDDTLVELDEDDEEYVAVDARTGEVSSTGIPEVEPIAFGRVR